MRILECRRAACAAAAVLAAGTATTAAAAATSARPTFRTGAAPRPLLFNGGFTSPDLKPWATPECANYGQPLSTTRTFGNFFLDTAIVGKGKASGRFDLPADSARLTRCEVFTNRPINVGGDDYYSLMVYLPKGWTPGTSAFWGVEIAQLGWEGIWGSTIDLQAHANHVTLNVQSGVCSSTSCQHASNADSPGSPNLPPLYAIPKGMQLGVWHELIVHVHWATDNSGVVEVWHRRKGRTAWTRTARLSGCPTLQVRPDGTYPPNALDKIGAYRAESTTPTSVWLNGFSRSQSFSAATANLP